MTCPTCGRPMGTGDFVVCWICANKKVKMNTWPDDKEILCYTCTHLSAMEKAHDHVIRMTCEVIPDAYIRNECIKWEAKEGE